MRNWARRILMCVVCSILAVSMFAVPAYRGWLTMEQPDGSTIQVRQVGDEFYHYMVNEAGQRIKQNADGYYVVAGEVPTPEVAKARRAAAMARKNIRRAPKAVGTEPNLAPKGVVILVNFKDDAMQSGHTRAVFDELCNSTNCTVNKYNNKNYGSAAQYFADQSNGSYRPQFDVYGPVTLSRNVSYYGTDKDTGDPDEDEGDDQHATDAVVEACILANQQYSDLNFANYDSDGDGYVDFVYVIYAGKGQADGGAATTIWPHNWEIENAIYYGYCTYTKAQCQIDGKKLNNYAMSGELSGSSLGGIGTLCHEFGHVMGLPDLYDTKYGTNYDNGVTPGDWNIMDGGSYNGNGHCPPNYDPWQKYFFGWVTPVNLATEGKNITLLPNGTEGYQSYQINSANKLQTATTSGVNYYIENRQKQGWDAFIPVSGMLVWKINFDASAWTNNTPNNTAGSPKYTIVPADGKTSDYGAAGDTYPTSTVRSYTPISGHALTEITKSGNNITFKYNGGQQKTECSYELLGEHCTYPADGKVAYNAALSLTITPEAGYTLADPSCWTVEMGTNNELVYGEGFTYNASTNEFRIEHVTDDIAIVVEGKEQVTLTWMSNGSQFAQTITAGSVVLPENEPEGCDGKVFVGWTKTANYESESTAPAFVKTGDAASQTTFYAVFATKSEGGGSDVKTYTFTSKSWAESTSTWTGTKDGNQYASNQGVQVTTGVTGAGAKTSQSFSGVTKAVVNYCTNASKGEGSIDVTIGSTQVSHNVTSTGGTTLRNLEFEFKGVSGAATLVVNCTTNSIYVNSITITSGGGESYSDYTTSCTPPCVGELTGITLNTNDVKKAFTEGETFTYEGLVVTANYDGCDSKTVVPTSVSTPNMSAVGQQTVTVTYEGKTATYEITINALPTYTIRFFNNGEQVGETQYVKQGQAATKPATDPTACDDYIFGGWFTEALEEDNTEKPTYVTDFKATKDQDYYAVFSMSEEGELSNNYKKITTLDELTTGNYVVAGNGSKAMKNSVYSNYYLGTTSVSPSSNIISDPDASIIWNITRSNSNSISFYNAAVNQYACLFQTGTHHNLKMQDAANWFTPTVSNNGSWSFESDDCKGWYLVYFIYSNTTHEFAAKESTSTSINLYKQLSSSTTYYTTQPNCVACTAAVTITKGTAANGSFSIDKTGEQSTCGGKLVVTVSNIVPAHGYRFKEITQTGIEGAIIDQEAKTITYAKKANGASTINVVFEEKSKYTIAFFDNGTQIGNDQVVYEGDKPEVPADPTPACSAYTFVGWWIEELAANNTETKEWVSDFTATKDQNYYAIYKKTVTTGSPSANVTFDSTDGTSELTSISSYIESATGIASYSGTKTFESNYGVRIGSGSYSGSITLTLNPSITTKTITVDAKKYGSDSGTISVKVNGSSTNFGNAQSPSSTGGNLTFTGSETTINSVTVATSTKRSYIKSITVGTGLTSTTYYSSTVSCGGGTAVENTSAEQVAVKALMNGQIVIIRGEAVYSITGVRIQ